MADAGVAAQAQAVQGSTIADLVSNAELLKLFDYWCSKRRGRPMPAKADIDPVEIPWALNRIFLLDYDPEDGFRYRLAGEEIAKVFGHANLKGLRLDDILSAEGADKVEARWMPMVEGPCVLSMTGMVYFAAKSLAVGERLLMPLADEAGGPVTGAFGMTVCEWLPDAPDQTASESILTSLPVCRIP